MPSRGRIKKEPFDLPTVSGPIAAPEGPQRSVSGRRFKELDGHRGVAILGIVVFHVYQFCNVQHFLYFGTWAYTLFDSLDAMVPWFFVITAFLLFEPIAGAVIDGREQVSARGFLARRAVRVLPVYYIAIGVVWFTRQQSLPGDWHDLLEHLTFTQVFDAKRIFYTVGPAWSISVTVFFYAALLVLAVVLARVCRRLASRKQRIIALAIGVSTLAVVSLAWKAVAFAVLHQSTTGSPTTWFGPLANLDNFAAGMAVAVVAAALGTAQPLGGTRRLALRLTGLCILIAAFLTRQADTWPAVYFSATCAIGFACLVAAAVLGPPGDRWGRAFSWRPLIWLGITSYSIYLWHEPIMLALRHVDGVVRQTPGAFPTDSILVVFASLGVGAGSYWLIERPSSRLKDLFDARGHLAVVRLAAETEKQAEHERLHASSPV